MNITLNANLMNEVIRVYENQEFEVNRQVIENRYTNLASLTNALTVTSFIPKKGSVTIQQLAKMSKMSTQNVRRVVDLLVVSGLAKNVSKTNTQHIRLV